MAVGTITSSYKLVAEDLVRPSYIAIAAATVGVFDLFEMTLTGTARVIGSINSRN
jgi:hypothetical protein